MSVPTDLLAGSTITHPVLSVAVPSSDPWRMTATVKWPAAPDSKRTGFDSARAVSVIVTSTPPPAAEGVPGRGDALPFVLL